MKPHPARLLAGMILRGEEIPRHEWLMTSADGLIIDASYVYYFLGLMGTPQDLERLFPHGLSGSPREKLGFHVACMKGFRFGNLLWAGRQDGKFFIWGIYDAIKTKQLPMLLFILGLMEVTLVKNTPAQPIWTKARLRSILIELIRAEWWDGFRVFLNRALKATPPSVEADGLDLIIRSILKWASPEFTRRMFNEVTTQCPDVNFTRILKFMVRYGRLGALDLCLKQGNIDISEAFKLAVDKCYFTIIETLLKHAEKDELPVDLLNRALKLCLRLNKLELARRLLWKGAELKTFVEVFVRLRQKDDPIAESILHDYVLGVAARWLIKNHGVSPIAES